MAFDAAGLVSFATGGSINPATQRRTKLWHYITNDTQSEVVANGYFDSVDDLLQKGDIIFVTADQDGTPAGEIYHVSALSDGDVTIVKFVDAT